MRVIASILVVYFSLLIMQPFANMKAIAAKPYNIHRTGMCCKKMEHHKGQMPVRYPTTCNTDFCNPFVPCGISMIYRAQQLNFVKPVFELSKKKKPTINENITSDYLADCWRPPELLS
jgi:hypothetical protein